MRRRLMAGAMALTVLTACDVKTPDEILSVTDPDIINPTDVQSAAGASAVRVGALARLNAATSGGESMFLLGGLFADEWNNGDTFIDRQQIDQRIIIPSNSFLTTANRVLHRARLSAEQAVGLLRQYNPTGPAADVAEMYFVQAYTETLLAEHFCSGIVLSDIVEGAEQYGKPMTVQEVFERALAHADSGLATVSATSTAATDVRVRNALRVVRGRILLNLNRPADAGAAVAGVPTNFAYQMLHAQTTTTNQMYEFNNSARRYSVSDKEGGNGLDFATAKDPRLPVCVAGDAPCRAAGTTQTRRDDNTSTTLYVQLLWPARESSVTIVGGVEARLIEAEAQLRAGNPSGALGTLNALRTTVTGLAPLTQGATTNAQVDQLFRERAFWMFSTGHRTGDLRRLVRQYNRTPESVFPTGAWHKGGNYGTDVNVPVPQAEENNPNVPRGQTCIDRSA